MNDTARAERLASCKSCRASIVWLETTKGKRIPVEAETVEADDTVFDPKRHVSHFAKCPNANQHRRSR